MKNKFLVIVFVALMVLLAIVAIAKVSTRNKVSVEPQCNDGISYDHTEDGTLRMTYIPDNDTCKNGIDNN